MSVLFPLLQIGKSGASWVTQAFLLGCGSIAAAMPFTGVIFAGVIVTWINVSRRPMCSRLQWSASLSYACLGCPCVAAVAPRVLDLRRYQDGMLVCSPLSCTAGSTIAYQALLHVVCLQATLGLHKQMQATEKGRLAEQAAAAAAAAASPEPALAFAGAAAGGAVSGTHSPVAQFEDSTTSTAHDSSSNGAPVLPNGHHVPIANGASGDLHSVRLSGGATYSPSVSHDTSANGGSGNGGGEQNGGNGSAAVQERSKVKLQ